MTDADLERFAKVIATLGEIYQDVFSAVRYEAYFTYLKRFDITDIEHAVPTLLETCKFTPKPFDFVEAIEGTPTDRALRAVTRVQVAAASVGPYHSVSFGTDATGRLTQALIEHMGGWVVVCNRVNDQKDKGYFVSEFTKLHRLFEKHRPDVVTGHLMGIFEQQNRLTRGSWDKGIEHKEELWIIDDHGLVARRVPLQLAAAGQPQALEAHAPEPTGKRERIPEDLEQMLDRWKADFLDGKKLQDTVERHRETPDSGETFFEGGTQ